MSSWKLFPISPGLKVPALSDDWRSISTSDPAQIEAWREAGYDLGVDCGASGLLVVDLDGAEGLATAAGMDLPPTYTMRTPRGGKHLYYSGVGPSSVQRLGPKVDSRGTGGYVVWEGPGYELIEDKPVAPLRPWIVPALNITKDRKPSQPSEHDQTNRALAYLSVRKPAIEGEGGNDHTYQTFAALRDLGISVERAIDLMLEGWNERCLPPWDEDELVVIADNAYHYGQNEEGAQAFDFDPKTRFAGIAYEPLYIIEKQSRFRLWSLAEARARPKPTFLFPGILPARAFGIAYGPPENGKTWLLIDMAMRIALGWSLSGAKDGVPHDVVFYAGEGFEDIVHSRCDAWCDFHGVRRDPPHFHLMEDFPNVTSEDDIDEAVAEVRKRAPDLALLIVDTYARAMAEAGLSENDPLDVMKFVRQMEVLKRGFGCTVLAIHHSGKDLERQARGSNTLIAAADFGFEIVADWSVMALKLSCAKMKIAKRFEPLYYEAMEHDGGLVVRGITASAHKALTSVSQDEFGPRAVQAALASCHAYGPERAVNTWQLAARMYVPQIGEPESEIQAKTDRMVRKLNALSKGRFEHLIGSEGWYFPAVEINEPR